VHEIQQMNHRAKLVTKKLNKYECKIQYICSRLYLLSFTTNIIINIFLSIQTNGDFLQIQNLQKTFYNLYNFQHF